MSLSSESGVQPYEAYGRDGFVIKKTACPPLLREIVF